MQSLSERDLDKYVNLSTQKPILVTFSESIKNDVDVPGTSKLPNSKLIIQIAKEHFDLVGDLQFVIRHPISQKGTVKTMQDAHSAKSIALTDMATWTVSDGAVFLRLLGTRKDMKCKVVTKIFTWAQLPTSPTQGRGAMILELGPTTAC
jgi:hypothetical protein